LLRQQLSGRMPDRLGADEDTGRSGRGASASVDADFSSRIRWQAARVRRRYPIYRRPQLARFYPVLRILSRRYGPRVRSQPSDRLDGPRRTNTVWFARCHARSAVIEILWEKG